jgi:hypothetical protein
VLRKRSHADVIVAVGLLAALVLLLAAAAVRDDLGLAEFVYDVLLAVATSIFTALAFWYVLQWRIGPRVSFADFISIRFDKPSQRYVYRVKLWNPHRSRSCLDVEVRCAFRMQGLDPDLPYNTTGFVFSEQALMRLEPRGDRIVHLSPDSLGSSVHSARFPSELQTILADRKGQWLEEMMRLDVGIAIRVEVLVTDELTGVRRYYRSKDYRCDDILPNEFSVVGVDLGPPTSSPKASA